MRRMVLLAVVGAAVLVPASSVLAESAADKAMAQQIGVLLKDSGQLRDYRIGVKYQDGVAWLTGSVADEQQRDIALKLTKMADGVAHVICKLEVENKATSAQLADYSSADEQPADTAEYLAGPQPSQVTPVAAVTYSDTQAKRKKYGQSAKHRRATTSARSPQSNMPLPAQRTAAPRQVQPAAGAFVSDAQMGGMRPAAPMAHVPHGQARAVSYDNAQMPGYSWPSYSAYPNYAALAYPRQYSPSAWPYIGPFYPYPQVPLGWRKVSLEWDDGWWFLDFSSCGASH